VALTVCGMSVMSFCKLTENPDEPISAQFVARELIVSKTM
jgi:hypothetical protein